MDHSNGRKKMSRASGIVSFTLEYTASGATAGKHVGIQTNAVKSNTKPNLTSAVNSDHLNSSNLSVSGSHSVASKKSTLDQSYKRGVI